MGKKVGRLAVILWTAVLIASCLSAKIVCAKTSDRIIVDELLYMIITEAEEGAGGTVGVYGVKSGNKEKIIKVPPKITYKKKNYSVVFAGVPGGMVDGQRTSGLWGKSVTRVELPDTVTAIREYAFLWTENLEYIRIPDRVEDLGDGAFLGCSKLKKVEFPKEGRLRRIGGGAFLSSGLEFVKLPPSVRSIETLAFGSCFYLRQLVIPKGVAFIGTGAVAECTNILSLKVEAGNPGYKTENNVLFTRDGKRLLAAPSVSGNYTVPDWVEIIEREAFSSNNRIRGISMPDTVTYIGDSAFEECERLETVAIPDSVRKIGVGAFNSCTIKRLEIPGSVKEIGAYAFQFNDLRDLELKEGIERIGEGAFQSNLKLEKINIPASVAWMGGNIFGQCSKLVNIEVAPENSAYRASGGMLFDLAGERLLAYPSATGNIVINNNVKIIGEWAFSSCDMTRVVIPASVDEIERAAFYGCRELQRVEFQSRDIRFPEELYDDSQNDNRIFGDTDPRMVILIPRDLSSPPLPVENQFEDIYAYWDALKTYYTNYQDRFRYALLLHSDNARVMLK